MLSRLAAQTTSERSRPEFRTYSEIEDPTFQRTSRRSFHRTFHGTLPVVTPSNIFPALHRPFNEVFHRTSHRTLHRTFHRTFQHSIEHSNIPLNIPSNISSNSHRQCASVPRPRLVPVPARTDTLNRDRTLDTMPDAMLDGMARWHGSMVWLDGMARWHGSMISFMAWLDAMFDVIQPMES